MSPSSTPVFTAVAAHDDDDVRSMITQPLLDEEEQGHHPQKKNNNNNSNTQPHDPAALCSKSQFVAMGTITGFLIQVVSLGAYALLLIQYSKTSQEGQQQQQQQEQNSPWNLWPTTLLYPDGDNNNASSSFLHFDWFVYGILSVLTQIDLVIYVLIWIAFTCTMTKNGMQFIRFQFANASSSSSSSQVPTIKRRWVFVLGVYFLVGIVLGAFCAWSMIDVYLGFPIPFLPIVATVGVDLILCYLMVWCYDLGRTQRGDDVDEDDDEDDDDSDDEECMCC